MPETWKSWHGPLLRASDLWTEEEDRLLWLQDQEYQTECHQGQASVLQLPPKSDAANAVRGSGFRSPIGHRHSILD
ncbi:hypothetical protein J6590_042540 [Homalodisca vitripennis]|nr:hypothetical protein J6590_042540 [Homalodisca vitripennis]